MATDQEIANEMNDYLRARGYTCGRNYADLGGLANGIAASLPGESPQSLIPKMRAIAANPAYEFKRKDDTVSASDKSDPRCGTD